jgi:hypothetical protein
MYRCDGGQPTWRAMQGSGPGFGPETMALSHGDEGACRESAVDGSALEASA